MELLFLIIFKQSIIKPTHKQTETNKTRIYKIYIKTANHTADINIIFLLYIPKLYNMFISLVYVLLSCYIILQKQLLRGDLMRKILFGIAPASKFIIIKHTTQRKNRHRVAFYPTKHGTLRRYVFKLPPSMIIP